MQIFERAIWLCFFLILLSEKVITYHPFWEKRVHDDFTMVPMTALFDSDYLVEKYELDLLNEKHTIKRFLIHTENKKTFRKSSRAYKKSFQS